MTHSDSHHSFSMELAEIYGVNEAIVIHHLQHWIKINRRMKRNFHEERTWTYQTQAEIAASMPYFSEDVVFRIIKKLEKEGVILKGNFNKHPFDKTVWYAFVDEITFIGNTQDSNNFTDTAESRLAFPEIAEAIPYPKPDPKPNHPLLPSPILYSKEKIKKDMKTKKNNDFTEKEFERAWEKYEKYKDFVGDDKSWLWQVILSDRVKQSMENEEEELCNAHRKEAQEYEGFDGLGYIKAELNEVTITGNHTAFFDKIPYAMPEEEWKRRTSRYFIKKQTKN